jgi:hypothetical protein
VHPDLCCSRDSSIRPGGYFWFSRRGGTSGAAAYLPVQQSPHTVWQQVGLQLPPQHAPQAAFADLTCEVCAKAVAAKTRASESITIVRFMRISLTLMMRFTNLAQGICITLEAASFVFTSGAV